MKVLYIEARKKTKKINVKNFGSAVKKLPREISIFYTIQYRDLAEKLKDYLVKNNFSVLEFRQILGCTKIKKPADILLIGSGKFHALQLALQTKKRVLIYEEGRINEIEKEEIENYEREIRGKLSKFYNSEHIGLLVSLKAGQFKLEKAKRVKKLLERKFKDKKFYLFIADTINTQELENFPCFFVNFACPGLNLDSSRLLNYEDIF